MSDLIIKSWKHDGKESSEYSAFDSGSFGKNKSRRPLELARTRLIVAGFMFTACFLLLATRIIDLSLIGADSQIISSNHGSSSKLTLERRDIVDRNNIVLATNLPFESLYVDPSKVLEPEIALAKIKDILPQIDEKSLLRQINSGGTFHWVKRGLTPNQIWKINNLGLPGFIFKKEEKRVYPHGTLFAHVLGYTDPDNKGISGIESGLDSKLKGKNHNDASPLMLSLDIRIQHALVIELSEAMAIFKAKGSSGIVMDVNSGEIIALASLPAFDPNLHGESSKNEKFNRATLGVYELGSVFKIFNTALALDSGIVSLDDKYDATKPLKKSGHLIRDTDPKNRWLNVSEIFIHSSNIGSAQIATDVGTENQREFLSRLGMLNSVNLEIPEVAKPLSPRPWRPLNTMTVSYGYGISVTPLHVLNGFSSLVNGGFKREPTLLKRNSFTDATEASRIISLGTSDLMRKLLYRAVTEGTGGSARVEGYLVGGKTGTADKAILGGYKKDAVISTFIAAFPIDKPRYAVIVSLDEPKGNKATFNHSGAGWTAAPTVGRIISRVGPLLGVESINPPNIESEDPNIVRPVINILRTKFIRGESATF